MAETIEKLISREFISRGKGGSIRANPHGIRLIDMLRRIPVEWITSADLTGEMESKLSGVQKGNVTRSEYMETISSLANELVESIRNHDRNQFYVHENSVGCCPECNGVMKETVMSYL